VFNSFIHSFIHSLTHSLIHSVTEVHRQQGSVATTCGNDCRHVSVLDHSPWLHNHNLLYNSVHQYASGYSTKNCSFFKPKSVTGFKHSQYSWDWTVEITQYLQSWSRTTNQWHDHTHFTSHNAESCYHKYLQNHKTNRFTWRIVLVPGNFSW